MTESFRTVARLSDCCIKISYETTLIGVVAVLLLVAFVGIGIAHIFKPDWFIKRSHIRRGGEMLTEYNQAGFQIAGVILAAIAKYVLYDIFVRW